MRAAHLSLRRWLLASACLPMLAGCTPPAQKAAGPADGLTLSAAIDADVTPPAGADQTPAPTLSSIMDESAPLGADFATGTGIRDQAIAAAALAYGARAGLAYGSERIDEILNAERAPLGTTWDMGPLEIKGPDGTRILPPVISQRSNVYQQPDANTVLIADQQYEIVAPARFSPVVPLWQSYLILPWSQPTKPDYSVYPKTPDERQIWKTNVTQGWNAGEEQALDTFRVKLSELQRDYTGMLTWAELVSEGKATSPVIASSLENVTGGGNNLTIGQGIVRLTAPAQLNANVGTWLTPTPVLGTPATAAAPVPVPVAVQ